MKKTVKFILPAALLVLIVAFAAVLYPALSQRYEEEAAVPAETFLTADSSVSSETAAFAETAVSSETPAVTAEEKPAEPAPEKAADFTVYDTDGNPVRLSDMTGTPTIVNFWATWCKYCVEEFPLFDRYAEEYGDRIDFMMVDLPDGYRETEEKALAFAEKEGYGFPIYFDSDGSASDAYPIYSIPMTLLIDRDGNLYRGHIGLMKEESLQQYIDALLGESTGN